MPPKKKASKKVAPKKAAPKKAAPKKAAPKKAATKKVAGKKGSKVTKQSKTRSGKKHGASTRKPPKERSVDHTSIDVKDIKPVELEELLGKFSLHLLKSLCEENSIKGASHFRAKKECVTAIVDCAITKGSKSFLELLDKEHLKSALEHLGVKVEHDSKIKMLASYKSELDKFDTLADFFLKN